MKTKEEILNHCVYVGDDGVLAVQVSRQFERLGLRWDGESLADVMFPYACVLSGIIDAATKEHIKSKIVTTLPELIVMIDEYLGVDEYAIVKEYLQTIYPLWAHHHIDGEVWRFKESRTKLKPTMEELIAAYAESKGVKIEQVEPKIQENERPKESTHRSYG